MEGAAAGRPVPVGRDLLAAAGRLGARGRVAPGLAGVPGRPGRAGPAGLVRVLRRRDVRGGKKGGACVGKTRKGKGTKLVVVVDGEGVPLALTVAAASRSAVRLVEPTLDRLKRQPDRLVLDREFDSDRFRGRVAARGTDPIVPYRATAARRAYADGRKLRRYKRRWKVERTFAWLGNFRRLVTRYERKHWVYRAFVHVACLLITLRQF